MSPEEANVLMNKRGFMNMFKTGAGIYGYCLKDISSSPKIGVEVIPEREEFRFIYTNKYSINRIETPWCGSIKNTSHVKRIYKEFKKWTRKIEEMYQEEE